MPSPESYQLLLTAAAACEDKKAEDIRILALDPAESGLTDYFLICNGTNERQNVAIVDEIELRLKRDFNTYPNSVEGRRQAEWILMDYVDFIVSEIELRLKRDFNTYPNSVDGRRQAEWILMDYVDFIVDEIELRLKRDFNTYP